MESWEGSPSFNRPELVRFDSLRDSKDLGVISDIKASLSGFIGGEVGTQSLFFSFELIESGVIQVQVASDDKWTKRFLSVGLRLNGEAVGLDERGNARGIDVVNTISADEAALPFPPGKYTIVVGCSQWQATPFGLILRVNPVSRLSAVLIGTGGLNRQRSLRVAVARPVVRLTGRGYLRAPGAGLFSGRRDRPLGSLGLTGRGRLTRELSVRERLAALPGLFLTGRGSVGSSTLQSSATGPRMWVSRLATPTENSSDTLGGACLTAFDYSFQTLYFLPAGAPDSQRRLAIVYRSPSGTVLWIRITDIYCLSTDSSGWQLMTTPAGDVILYSRSQAVFGGSAFGLYAMRIGLDGTVYWKRQVFLHPTDSISGNSITQITDAVWHLGRNRIIFSALMATVPTYIVLNPDTGALDSARILTGGTLTIGFPFGAFARVNAPLIKADGRLLLSGAKINASPSYTWLAECDASLGSVNLFYKYTDGAGLVFARCVVQHFDSSITLMADDLSLLQLNPDLSILRRVTNPQALGGFGNLFQLSTDALGALHMGDGNGFASRDYEGELGYRVTTWAGLPGRVDQGSTRKPGPWFKPETQWAIISTAGQGAGAGLGNLTIGFELDMAPTTVSGTGYSITIGTSGEVRNAKWVEPPIVARTIDVIGGGIATPPVFFTPVTVVNTSTPSWNPNFGDGSAILTYEYRSAVIPRGLSSGFPQYVPSPAPTAEPDPLLPAVTLHLSGAGVADATTLSDTSNYNNQAIPLGACRHSIEQARFPDISGRYEPTSIRFAGGSDAIRYAPSSSFAFGTGNFTIEGWFYLTGYTGVLFDNSAPGDPDAHLGSFYVYVDDSGLLTLFANGLTRVYGTARTAVPVNTWVHIALVRDQQIWRLYVNGRVEPGSWRFDLLLVNGSFMIGRRSDATAWNLRGFVNDFRVTLAARYTRRFTPRPSPIQYTPRLTLPALPPPGEPADSGLVGPDLLFNATRFLLRMNGVANVFIDSGPFDLALVPYGNAQQIAGGKWGGNQGSFDGFGDAIDTAASTYPAAGAGDFTLDLWATRIGDGQGPEAYQTLVDSRTAEPSIQLMLRLNRTATGRQLVLFVDGATRILGAPMTTGLRYHIALIRANGIITLYMNGQQAGDPWASAANFSSSTWTFSRARFSSGGNLAEFHGNINDLRLVRAAISPAAPTRAIGVPPSATARYWRLFDFRSFTGSSGGGFALSELGIYNGRDRMSGTVATSSPAPVAGLLSSTQDLSPLINCTWDQAAMEQPAAFIQLDAGALVTIDAVRLATVSRSSLGIGGFSLAYSNDGSTWSTLGHINGYELLEATLTARLGLMPLATDPDDADFDRVSMLLRGDEGGTGVLDSGPRAVAITNVAVTKSAVESVRGGQSLLFSAADSSYLGLAETQGRCTFFSFGTGSFSIQVDIRPISVPVTQFAIYDTNAIGEAAARVNGFLLALTPTLRLTVYANSATRLTSVASIPVNAWTRVILTRDAVGTWRLSIAGAIDPVTFSLASNLNSRTFTIGRDAGNGASPGYFNGYMDEITVSRGITRGYAPASRDLQARVTGRGSLGLPTLVAVSAATLTAALGGRGRLSATISSGRGDDYFASLPAQVYAWDRDIRVDWWGD